MISISTNLKRLRKSRKLSNQRIADMIGVSRTTYSSWEKGQEPKLRWAVILAKFHNLSIDQLISDNIRNDKK